MSRTRMLPLMAAAALLGSTAALAQEPDPSALPDELAAAFPPGAPCPVLTITKGWISGYGMDRPGFSGAELIINGPAAWQAFWTLHTGGQEPRPPLPNVDFRRFVVIAAIQGPQTSGGGPNVAILDVVQRDVFTLVRIFDDRRPGPLDVITNPFHVVAVPRACVSPHGSLVVERMAPRPESAVVEGRVLTPDEDGPRPVPFARVALRAANADTDPPACISGFDGSFYFVNVPAGDYVVAARKPGFEPAQEAVLVRPGAHVDVELVLVPQVPQTGAVAGHVGTAGAGTIVPVPGALVLLIDPRAGAPGIVAETRTNDRGAYGFPELVPQHYRVRVQHPDFLPAVQDVEVVAGETATLNFRLEPRPQDLGGLAGQVVGVTGNETTPLAGALVRVAGADGTLHRMRTDAEGLFAFDRLPAGSYSVAAFKRGWTPARTPVEIVAGQVTNVVLELLPAEAPAGVADDAGVETDAAAPALEALEEL